MSKHSSLFSSNLLHIHSTYIVHIAVSKPPGRRAACAAEALKSWDIHKCLGSPGAGLLSTLLRLRMHEHVPLHLLSFSPIRLSPTGMLTHSRCLYLQIWFYRSSRCAHVSMLFQQVLDLAPLKCQGLSAELIQRIHTSINPKSWRCSLASQTKV